MDVIGAGGPLGSRQLLTAQNQVGQTQATRVDQGNRQAARNRSSVQSVQETATAASAQASGQAAAETPQARTAQRSNRALSAADLQNRQTPLPRGSLVNILV